MLKSREDERASVNTIIGVDQVKNVFQLHGAAADGTVVLRKNPSRPQFHRFMSEHPCCVVAMRLAAARKPLGARNGPARACGKTGRAAPR